MIVGHENFQNKLVGLDVWPPVSTYNMCRDLDSPESVEPKITKKYKKHVELKTINRSQFE